MSPFTLSPLQHGEHHTIDSSYLDPLTLLANRDLQLVRLENALKKAYLSHTTIGFLAVAVDRLDIVSEALTYEASDTIMKEIAGRIIRVTMNPDIVARIDGQHFGIILTDLTSVDEAARLAARICEAAREPIHFGTRQFRPTVSVGISTDNGENTPHEVLRRSIVALQQAIEGGRDRWAVINMERVYEAERKMRIEQEMRQAVSESRIVPWFQPIVNLNTREVVGYEALARCLNKDGSALYPENFIPVAEESDLIIKIDQQVFFKVLTMLQTIADDQFISVNVSLRSLTSQGYMDWLISVLSRHEGIAHKLHLELTETALLDIDQNVRESMLIASALGVRWYADDFGTGYSSMTHLKELPISGLKLDLSFMSAITNGDVRSQQLAQGLVALANEVGIDTVAEGVDSENGAMILVEQGWENAQGWHFGKPKPFER